MGEVEEVTLYSPGAHTDLSLQQIILSSSSSSYKASQVIIHARYVRKVRERDNIALVKLARNIEPVPGELGPICLPSPGSRQPRETAHLVGWGTLGTKVGRRRRGLCFTNGAGPDQFVECRRRFVYRGDLVVVDHHNGCSNLNPPSDLK